MAVAAHIGAAARHGQRTAPHADELAVERLLLDRELREASDATLAQIILCAKPCAKPEHNLH